MKVILLHDVPKVGKKYDLKNVADGYAQNALIPKGLVTPATRAAIRRAEMEKKRREGEQKIKTDLLLKNFSSLSGVTVEVVVSANEKGHLFSGIHKPEILKALYDQKHLDIPESSMVLEKPIKEVGEHKIEVTVGGQKGSFTVAIKAL